MALAVSAGGGSPENVAYVQPLLGDLELERGRVAAAAGAYRQALAGSRGLPPGARPASRESTWRGAGSRRGRRRCARPPTGCRSRATCRAGRGRAGARAAQEAGSGELDARARAAAAPARGRHACRTPSSCSSRPTTAMPGRAVRSAARVRARAERALGRRARLGPHARGPAARGPALGAASAAARLARPALPLPRRHGGAGAPAGRRWRGASCGWPCRSTPRFSPWLARGRRAGRRCDEGRCSLWSGRRAGPRRAGSRRPPARQLLDQPPDHGHGLERPRGPALRARPGGDPHGRGAAPVRDRGARAEAARGGRRGSSSRSTAARRR